VKREAVIAGLASEGLALLLGSAEAGSSAVSIFFIQLHAYKIPPQMRAVANVALILLLCERAGVLSGSTARCRPVHGPFPRLPVQPPALLRLAKGNVVVCLGLRGGKGSNAALARAKEKKANRPHYKERAARARQDTSTAAVTGVRGAGQSTPTNSESRLRAGGLEDGNMPEFRKQERKEIKESLINQWHDLDQAEEGSAEKGVGWEAVGAGVTNARELLGLEQKREWTSKGKPINDKSRFCCFFCCVLAAIVAPVSLC